MTANIDLFDFQRVLERFNAGDADGVDRQQFGTYLLQVLESSNEMSGFHVDVPEYIYWRGEESGQSIEGVAIRFGPLVDTSIDKSSENTVIGWIGGTDASWTPRRMPGEVTIGDTFLARCVIRSSGAVSLWVDDSVGSITGSATAGALTEHAQGNMLMQFASANGTSVVVAGPLSPGSETIQTLQRYTWMPENNEAVTAFHNASSQGDQIAVNMVFNDTAVTNVPRETPPDTDRAWEPYQPGAGWMSTRPTDEYGRVVFTSQRVNRWTPTGVVKGEWSQPAPGPRGGLRVVKLEAGEDPDPADLVDGVLVVRRRV